MNMTDASRPANLLAQLEYLNAQQLRRLLVEAVDCDDLLSVQDWLRTSKPTAEN
jgi:hypothetical protein